VVNNRHPTHAFGVEPPAATQPRASGSTLRRMRGQHERLRCRGRFGRASAARYGARATHEFAKPTFIIHSGSCAGLGEYTAVRNGWGPDRVDVRRSVDGGDANEFPLSRCRAALLIAKDVAGRREWGVAGDRASSHRWGVRPARRTDVITLLGQLPRHAVDVSGAPTRVGEGHGNNQGRAMA